MEPTNTPQGGSDRPRGPRRPFYRNRRNRPTRPDGTPAATTAAGATGTAQTARPRSHAGTERRPRTEGAAEPKRASGRGKRRGNYPARRSSTNPALTHRMNFTYEKSVVLPEVKDEDTVRIIPVSGVEEIGRNMNIIETKDDIIVIDAGFQFVSEESNAPGINYILPNTQYLEERKHKIRALVITHGHLDHIGGIPFIMERIGNPPIYTQYLTSLMIQKRQEEFPHLDPVQMNIVKEGETFTVGNLKIETFPVTHSIPDAMGLSIKTKHGNVVVTGDIKIVTENDQVVVEEKNAWEKIGEQNNIALLCDSTNADREGFSASETKVYQTLDEIIRTTRGRLVIGTFASQFDRLIAVIKSCEDMGKKVVMEGRSIKVNIEIAILAKLIEVKPDTFIGANEINISGGIGNSFSLLVLKC